MQRRYLSIYFQAESLKSKKTFNIQSLLLFCKRYTPLVSLDEPSGILLDVTGCDGIFKTEKSLLLSVHTDFKRLGMGTQVALAPNPLCARSFARFKPFSIIISKDIPWALYTLPIESLELEAKVEQTLHDLGIKKLVELFRLPRAQVLARFGIHVIHRIEAIRGERQEARAFVEEEPDFSIKEELMETVRDSSHLLDTLFEVLKTLCKKLSDQNLGLQTLLLNLTHLDRKTTQIKIGLVSPLHDATQIFRLLSLKLEHFDAGFGVDAIELRAMQIKNMSPQNISLSGKKDPYEKDLSMLFDTLLCRVKKENIFQYVPQESHVPEKRFKSINPYGIIARTSSQIDISFFSGSQKPTYLLDPPEPIRVIAMLPDSPPRKFIWKNKTFIINKANGPERIELPWWTGSEQYTRDYYQIEDARGFRVWVFKQSQSQHPEPTWFIHGLIP